MSQQITHQPLYADVANDLRQRLLGLPKAAMDPIQRRSLTDLIEGYLNRIGSASDADEAYIARGIDILELLSHFDSMPVKQKRMTRASEMANRLISWARNKANDIRQRRRQERQAPASSSTLTPQPETQEATNFISTTLPTTTPTGLANLPPELLLQIADYGADHQLPLAWTFSHTNSFLRTVMRSYGSPWSTINTLAGMPISFSQLYQSNRSPLDVSILPYTQDEVLSARGFINSMADLDRLHNIRRLQFICPYQEAFTLKAVLRTLFANRLAVEGELDIGFSHLNTIVMNLVGLIQLRDLGLKDHVVSPRHLTLRGFDFIDSERDFISCARLESMVLIDCRMTLDDLALVLHDARETIQHVRLERVQLYRPDEQEDPVSPITLPNLRSAEFISIPNAHQLQFIRAPGLQLLAYRPPAEETTWDMWHPDAPVPDNMEMPITNLADLRTLQLLDCPMSVAGWRVLFRRLPGLDDLQLIGCKLTRRCLETLFEGTDLACPQLTKLAIECESDLESSTVLDIIRARKYAEATPPIQELVLKEWSDTNLWPVDIEALRAETKCTIEDEADEEEVEGGDDDTASMETSSSKDSFYYEHEWVASPEEVEEFQGLRIE